MKKISLYIVALMAMAFTSCSDWLQEDPESFKDGTITTETDVQSRVNYLYRNGAPSQIASTGAYAGGNFSFNIFLTGYYQSSYEGQEVTARYARELTRQNNTNTVCNAVCNDTWESCYRAINTANTALDAIKGMESSSNLKTLEGEAKFFRAFNYFHLVKFFGGVPIYTEPTTGLGEENYKARASVDEVKTQIISDLNDAISLLPSATFDGNGHRVTKQIAQTMLGDLYFFYGDYANAKTLFKSVIDSGLFALVQNTDLDKNSYVNILRTTDDTKEAVYAMEYDTSISRMDRRTGNAFSGSMVAHATALGIYELILAPTEKLIAVYPANDLRVQNQQFFMTSADVQVKSDGTRWTWEWDGETRGDWYYCQESCLVDGIGSKDWNFYRYAEVLLDYAECCAQTGNVAEGAPYLAQIQARAKMDGTTAAELQTSLSSLSAEKFKEACWTERIKEFPLEYKLWDQCIRTQKYPQINGADDVTYVDLVGAKTAQGATVKSSDMLWPIPLQEIQRNPNLTQNDGYAASVSD